MARLAFFFSVIKLPPPPPFLSFSKMNSLKPYKFNRINTRECSGILLCTDCYMYSALTLHILKVNFQLQNYWDSKRPQSSCVIKACLVQSKICARRSLCTPSPGLSAMGLIPGIN